ncbi:hypothetical protein ETD83_29525 [Actinomadura soli]|uniref:VWFA domain-containing protein n=1 Tax=Actinomadura soli TaxID=2508997 RepID=A0A5C4J4J8_9ACTN|nr:hypothetical protein [Actinomadura soli]TMQ91744.1 hypothetical protein ETD83_29525 [Actinomadura soli]
MAIDGTASSNAKAITDERLAAVEQIMRRTAVCSGRLRVLVFSSSSAATITLYDQPLHPHGATDNARLKRVPKLVASAMGRIRPAYSSALTKLPGGGSDITGQLRHAADWQRQLGSGHRLEAYVFTDGLENVERRVGGRGFTVRKAKQLAATTTVPKLPGASLTVAGLGRVAGKPPRSSVVEGLVAYYTALCKKSGAASCLAVTDYAQAGR